MTSTAPGYVEPHGFSPWGGTLNRPDVRRDWFMGKIIPSEVKFLDSRQEIVSQKFLSQFTLYLSGVMTQLTGDFLY